MDNKGVKYQTNDSVRKLNKALIADTTAKGKRIVALEKSVRLFQDTLNKYRVMVGGTSDIQIDSKNVPYIPALATIAEQIKQLQQNVINLKLARDLNPAVIKKKK